MKYVGKKQTEVVFPLGGIGTGSIGITGNGRLFDWEIFNRPDKCSFNGYSHFAIRTVKDGKVNARVLQGDYQGSRMGQYMQSRFHGYGFGPYLNTLAGFPHFREMTFEGRFPFAVLTFKDQAFPATVKTTAFNPFIPSDAFNSSLPAAFFETEIQNTSNETLSFDVVLSVANPFPTTRNLFAHKGNVRALVLQNAKDKRGEKDYGELCIATDAEDAFIQKYWYRGDWMDGIVSFWNEFSSPAGLSARDYPETTDSTAGVAGATADTGTVQATVTLSPGERKTVRFVLSWYVPNNYNYWSPYTDENGKDVIWKNYYATQFEGAAAVAHYAQEQFEDLLQRTKRFADILHGSTLPSPVLDAVINNLSVLKSPTVLRLTDGSVYGWEGLHEKEGSCEGTCQHVWNYAYALCYLFPSLERSIRENEFKYSLCEDGRTAFRMTLPVGRAPSPFRACLDGQMGCVIKTYREWKLSGDDSWLRKHWDAVKKILSYAWSEENPDGWDKDHDGVLEGRQHHTLDMELFGPSSWLESMYLAALKAALEMAKHLDDNESAEEYRALFENGKRFLAEKLFNGRYFIQKIDVTDKALVEKYDAPEYFNQEKGEIKYQIGEGSAIDQMLGQWHADLLGLGDIFDRAQMDSAMDTMMQHNFRTSMRDFTNPWRLFSMEDEAGTLICAYPEGVKKPAIPIVYGEETMTGFEYAFAGLLFAHGRFQDGVKVTRAVRDRFDGELRNPFNEFECGSNYARSMASYALLPILSGFSVDMPKNTIGFAPKGDMPFSVFFSLDGAWGSFKTDKKQTTLCIEEGSLTLSAIHLPYHTSVSRVEIDGASVPFAFANGKISFHKATIKNTFRVFS